MSHAGAITSYIDVAQIVLYAFWIFFAGLIYYLLRENKREGYPLDSDRSERAPRVAVQGFPAMPSPKTFHLAHGGTATAPTGRIDKRELKAAPVAGFPGAPLEPTGDAMLDGVGPAAWTERADEPDLTYGGEPRLVPLRVATDHVVAARTRPARHDGGRRATARPAAWCATSGSTAPRQIVRYYEVEVAGGRRVLLPVNFSRITGGRVEVQAIFGKHFADGARAREARPRHAARGGQDHAAITAAARSTPSRGAWSRCSEAASARFPHEDSAMTHEHEFESAPGLPEPLPPGERVVWQGRPTCVRSRCASSTCARPRSTSPC